MRTVKGIKTMARMKKSREAGRMFEDIQKQKRNKRVVLFCCLFVTALSICIFFYANSSGGPKTAVDKTTSKSFEKIISCPHCEERVKLSDFKCSRQRPGFFICSKCHQAIPYTKLAQKLK